MTCHGKSVRSAFKYFLGDQNVYKLRYASHCVSPSRQLHFGFVPPFLQWHQRCIIFCPCLTHKLSSKLSELHKHIFLAFRIGSLTFNDWAISLVLNIHFKERVSTEREIPPILPCLRTPEDNFNSHNLEEGVLLVSTK